jgi:hypothetical protein
MGKGEVRSAAERFAIKTGYGDPEIKATKANAAKMLAFS